MLAYSLAGRGGQRTLEHKVIQQEEIKKRKKKKGNKKKKEDKTVLYDTEMNTLQNYRITSQLYINLA